LIKTIKNELDKEVQYTWIKDYYETNLSVSLLSMYNIIFKEIDLVLQKFLSPILLSLQRAQMKQSLLYQENLILANQITKYLSVFVIL